ncbi:hypothetical protein [Enterococcus wangshanyuanii]|uniref:Uncharacterized protein n=1 Tax=Enterococcus wangshanyuanii TaxID=2005703 RepID=A0ABQ1NSY9_9ENTE|nr:hypothetical protein [Enterococcus wangshanyuanii]GGC84580.1 hypothetical protein GCM10011573_12740 [Enterococcus wangshanyuanii]
MNALEEKFQEVRAGVYALVSQLADEAMKDSKTFHEAIGKVRSFKWKIVGAEGNFIIEQAILLIEKRSLGAEIKTTERLCSEIQKTPSAITSSQEDTHSVSVENDKDLEKLNRKI